MLSTRLMLPLSLCLLVLLHSGAAQEDNSAWEQLGINDMVKSKIEQATNGLSERAREYVNKFRELVVSGEEHNDDDMKAKVNEVKEDFKNADGNVQQEIKSYDNTLKSILTGLKGTVSDNNNKRRRRRSTQVSKEKVDEVKELSKSLSPEAKRIAHATFAVFRNASLSPSEKTEQVNSIRNNASDKSALQELEQFETKVGEAMNIKGKPIGQATTVTAEGPGPVKESTTTPVPTVETLEHAGGPKAQNRVTEAATANLEATDNIDSSSEEYKYSDEDQDKELSDEVQERADDIQNATIEKQKNNEEKVDSAIESTKDAITDTAATIKEETINTAHNAENAVDTSINKVTMDSS